MYQLATGPRGIGQVLDGVFKLFRTTFGPLLPFSIAGAVVGLVPLAYMFLTGALESPQAGAQPKFGLGYFVTVLVTMPLTFIILGAAVARGESVAQGQPIPAGQASRLAAARVVTLVLAAICYAVAVTIGLVLLIVPGLILMVSLYMFLPAIMLDEKGIIESLKYSHGLVWGNWWRTATIATIALLIVYLLYVIAGIVAGIVFMTAGVDVATMFIVQGIATFAGGIVVTPFFVALYLEIYRDLKIRKLGPDLAARIDAVGRAR